MSWEIARQKHYNALKNFIIRKEWAYTAFSSRLKTLKPGRLFPASDSAVMIRHDHGPGTIEDAVMISRHGLVFPVFTERFYPDIDPDLDPVIRFFSQYASKLHSIIGLASDVEKMEQAFAAKLYDQVDYYLMTLDRDQFGMLPVPDAVCPEIVCSGAYSIREAGVKDAEKLYTLQKNYEIEEVFLDPSGFDSRVCFLNLKKTLREELVLYIEKQGFAVAKAGTNARGFLTDQIGGVYTLKEERRNGIAYCVLYALLGKILARKHTVSLFVKKSNTPAISLYRKLGFSIRDNFRISYY